MCKYIYSDDQDNRHSVYSWKIVSTYKKPNEREAKKVLWDWEKEIERDLMDGINKLNIQSKTINQCFDEYKGI